MKARAEVTDVPSPQRAVQIAWALAITILTGYGAAVSIGRTTHGFIAYYAAARLFVAGDLSSDAYDDRWFGGYVQRITGTGVREIFTPNPPAMALMAVPLAGLQPQPARSIWLLASILAYAAAIALLLRHAPLTSTRWLPVAVFLLLVNPPVLANLRLGQAYLFVAAGYALMASMVIRNRQPLAGAVSGVLFALKTTGGPLFLLLATTRRWRALTTGVAAIGVVMALTAVRVDRSMWTAYPDAVSEMLNRPTVAVEPTSSGGLSGGRHDGSGDADRRRARRDGVGRAVRARPTMARRRHCPLDPCRTHGGGLSLCGSRRADRATAFDSYAERGGHRAHRGVAVRPASADGLSFSGRLAVAPRLSAAVCRMAAVGRPRFRSA